MGGGLVLSLLSYALRSLWARRMTTLATAGGIALLVFVLASSGMLASGMRQTVASAGDPSRAIVMQHDQWSEAGSRIDQSSLAQVAAAPGIRRDARGQPMVMGELVTQQILGDASAGRLSTLLIRGVSANVLELRPEVHVVRGRAIQPGTAEAIVGRSLSELQPELELGKSFELAAGRPVAVVGIFESGGTVLESEVWVDLDSARSAIGEEGKLSSVTAQLERPEALDAFALPLTEDKQTGLDVAREEAYYTKISGGMANVITALGAVEAVIFSVGAICATMIVFYGAVAQRRREVGVLRALGFRRRSILAAFLAESVALALAGSAFGVALAMCTPLLDFTTVNFATGTDVAFHFRPDPNALLIAVAVALGVGLIGGALPALRAARMNPVVAMRP
jgi:putative ABC transport system permease protein